MDFDSVPNIMPQFQNPNSSPSQGLIDLTSPEAELLSMEYSLLGQEMDFETGLIKERNEPLCNEKGAKAITRMAKGTVSQVTIMSNFEDDEIRKLVIYLAMTLSHALLFKRDQWDIKDLQASREIKLIVTQKSFSACMRAKENGERRLLRGTQQESIITTNMGGQGKGKGGFFKNVFGWS